MIDVPKNVLPDQEGTSSNVKEDVKTSSFNTEEAAVKSAREKSVQEEIEIITVEPTPKGSKTPETQLYTKLKEERERRRELEQELQALKESSLSSETEGEFTDTEKEIKTVKQKIIELERKETMRELMIENPQLADKRDEFDEFLEDEEMKKISLQRAAKLFLLEKNLLAQPKLERKGLESPVGGLKTPSLSGLAEEDVKRLRINQPKKYIKMIREGKLKAEEIK